MKLTTRRPVLELLEARLALSASNLIVNGDFTQGNTGFLSQYSHTPGNIGGAQTYDVASRLNVIGYGDHTTGNGNMLAVNGSNLANVLVWSQSVAVVPNTDYRFSLWSSSWFPQAPSPLGIRFNDAQIGIAQAPSTVGQWREFTANWNSGNLTSLTLFIFNNEGADIGGDFALDDISLTSGGTTLPPDQGSGNSGGSPSTTVPDYPGAWSSGAGNIESTAADGSNDVLAIDLNKPVTLPAGTYRASTFSSQFSTFGSGTPTIGSITPVLLTGSETNYKPVAVGATSNYSAPTPFGGTPFGGSDVFTLTQTTTIYAGIHWKAPHYTGTEYRMPVGFLNNTGSAFVLFGGGTGAGAAIPFVGMPVSGTSQGFFSRTYDFNIGINTVTPSSGGSPTTGPSTANLIINGDFSEGNTGFSTQYIHTPGNIGGAQTYDVAEQLNVISYGDHTTGSGKLLGVNGSNVPNLIVWSQAVNVVPNTDYTFSFWVSSWYPSSPSPLSIRFNGTEVGIGQAPSSVGQWRHVTFIWNSANQTSASISIITTQGADIGGDFALDDISLTSGDGSQGSPVSGGSGNAPVTEPVTPGVWNSGPGNIESTNADGANDVLAVDLNKPVTLPAGTYRATTFYSQLSTFGSGTPSIGVITPTLLSRSGSTYLPVAVGSSINYATQTPYGGIPFAGSDTFTLTETTTIYPGLHWNAPHYTGIEYRMPIGFLNNTGSSFVFYGGGTGAGAAKPWVGLPVSSTASGLFSRTYDFSITIQGVPTPPAASLPTAGINLVSNGDFSQGNTGFGTQHILTPGNIGGAQTYDVAERLNVITYGDHTSGTGKMLGANGSNLADIVVWTQTANVAPNTNYVFSFWVSSWYPAAPSPFIIRINGIPAGTGQASPNVGQWNQISLSWNSGIQSRAAISIITTEGSDVGGDFAIDDILLYPAGTTPPAPGNGGTSTPPVTPPPTTPSSGQNLIVNGDFSQGNSQFSTQYIFTSGNIGGAQTYDVVRNPALSRPNDINPVSYADHTTGTGNMLAVNGSNVPNVIVWSQSVSTTPNTSYTFSFWVSSWFSESPAPLAVLVNGSQIGITQAPSTVAQWTQYSIAWNSGNLTTANIAIQTIAGADIGGDFALDDLMLVPAGSSTSPGNGGNTTPGTGGKPPVNRPPVITAPSSATFVADVSTVLRGLRVTDTDTTSTGILNMVLTVNTGTLTVGTRQGKTLVFAGTLTGLNNALGLISYASRLDDANADTMTVKITDSGYRGAASKSAIKNVKLQPSMSTITKINDPGMPGRSSIVVHGSAKADSIKVVPGKVANSYQVSIGSSVKTISGIDGRILAFGFAGNDVIDLSAVTSIPTRLDGGDDNDVVKGGAVADTIFGGAGTDMLVGGLGADSLYGLTGNDMLIDGTAVAVGTRDTLSSILSAWANSGSATNAVQNAIAARLRVTLDSSSQDFLFGFSGSDWFWCVNYGDLADIADNVNSETRR